MKPELLCTWLGVPAAAWPPDPWTLLGLSKDEHDLAVIEKRVHERMTQLRCYQLSYPEEATEGMNRLAEAFIALTETCAKKQSAEAPCPAAANGQQETAEGRTAGAWRDEPPPVRQTPPDSSEPIVVDEGSADSIPVAKPFVPPTRPIRRGIDPALVRDLAEESEEATSNLATLEAVIERVDRTRLLLHAWEKLGKHLCATSKKATPKEIDAFAARLEKINQALKAYPAFLGQPGKPGYRVVVQARLRVPLAMVRAMNEEQREELVFDWQAGRQLLLAHRKYLRRLFKSMRHRSAVGLFLHAVRAIVNDHPLWVLLGILLLLAIIVAIVMALN